MDTPTETDPNRVKALATIARHGHMVQYEEGQDGAPALLYTVGLTASADHGFELALSGMDADSGLSLTTARDILNDAAKALSGKTPTGGMYVDGVLIGYPLRLHPASPETRFGWIAELYGHPPVWQLLWPDRLGRFPGDTEYGHPTPLQALL